MFQYPLCQADSVPLLGPCATGEHGIHPIPRQDTWLCTTCMGVFIHRRDKINEVLGS